MGGALRVGLDMAESQIISSDGHVIEPSDLWTTRRDRRFRDRAPHVV